MVTYALPDLNSTEIAPVSFSYVPDNRDAQPGIRLRPRLNAPAARMERPSIYLNRRLRLTPMKAPMFACCSSGSGNGAVDDHATSRLPFGTPLLIPLGGSTSST